jgi:hypothetical protein
MSQDEYNEENSFITKGLIAPVLATIFVLIRCHVPGGSPWQAIGFAIWFAIIVRCICLILAVSLPEAKLDHKTRKEIGRSAMLLILSISLVVTAPTLTFKMFKSSLISYLGAHRTEIKKSVSFDKSYQPTWSTDKTAGPYEILGYAEDRRGGIYLITTIWDGIEDQTFYGFAYKPSKMASDRPLYGISENLVSLGDDWYYF